MMATSFPALTVEKQPKRMMLSPMYLMTEMVLPGKYLFLVCSKHYALPSGQMAYL